VQCDIAERDTVVSEANIDCMRPYSKVFTRTDCGYAAIDVMNRKLDDRMDSFFLSETIKYLFLIFDEHNAANGPNIVFTTEGHLFPVDRLQTRRIAQVQVTSTRIHTHTHTHTHTLSLSTISIASATHTLHTCTPLFVGNMRNIGSEAAEADYIACLTMELVCTSNARHTNACHFGS
jgi:hypothetical protein